MAQGRRLDPAAGRADRRRHAERGGRRAEAAAELLLRLKGYRILARRYRTPRGEIDLIARRGRVIAFVEVKLRASTAAAAASITPTARTRIVAAAQAWLAHHPAHAGHDLRFDAILCTPWRAPRHIADAFGAGP
ncbi:MAG: YraN family protein [Alphaproteobacteria bacterium]